MYRLAKHLTVPLGSQLAQSQDHIRSSDSVRVSPQGHPGLFRRQFPLHRAVAKGCCVLSQHFDEHNVKIFRHVLTFPFSSFNGQLCKKTK
jgi:hypothetical protein